MAANRTPCKPGKGSLLRHSSTRVLWVSITAFCRSSNGEMFSPQRISPLPSGSPGPGLNGQRCNHRLGWPSSLLRIPQDPRSPPSLPAASPMPTPLLSSSLSSIALCTPVRASSASHGFPPLFSSWDRAAEKPAAPQTLYSHLVFSLRQSNRRVFHPTGRDHPLSGRAPFRPTSMHISSTICPFFPLFS